jgi:Response regulator of the LytR/AlgR family
MRITVTEDGNISETEILIRCKKRDGSVEGIIDALRMAERTVSVKKDGASHLVPLPSVLYFESVDDKAFCYTDKDVFEIQARLYEIEARLAGTKFFRVNRNIILNTEKIKSFKSELNGRMSATITSGERIEVSRNYVQSLKARLKEGGGA